MQKVPPLILTSDFQTGSRWGLWPPKFEMEDEATWQLSRGQKWLYECYMECVEWIPSGGVLGFNGDPVQGFMKPQSLVTPDTEWQGQAFIELLKPLLKKCKATHLVYGTEYHEGNGSPTVRRIYRELKSLGYDVFPPVLELWLSWARKKVHLAHHRPSSSSPMTKGTPLAGELAKMLVTAPQRNGRYPDIIVRSHAHEPGYLKTVMGISIALPGWQRKDYYVYRVAPDTVTRVGMMYLTFEDGAVVIHEKSWDVPTPPPRVVS